MKNVDKDFLYLLLLSQVPLSAFSHTNPEKHHPNVIFILADDMAYADLSCFGCDSYQTPNLDKLASEGIKLTDFYSQPTSSPARAALMTGCYPNRVGMSGVIAPRGPQWTWNLCKLGLDPKEETIADLLKQNGYTTSCIGKWHLGHHPDFMPLNQGFDEFFGLPYSNDMILSNGYPPLPLIKNDKVEEYEPDQKYLTTRFTDKAIDFIKRSKDKPFFLYLAYTMPHFPISCLNMNTDQLYKAVIEELDSSIGRLMNELKKQGLDDETLVMFSSDNGPWLIYGNYQGSAKPYSHGKFTVFEGGMREPFIARWKGHIKSNSVSHEIAGLIDVLPTVCDITNSPLPKDKIDGISIKDVLLGKKKAEGRKYEYYGNGEALAIRRGNWKLHLPHDFINVIKPGVNGNQGKQINDKIGLSLFDLSVDPGEKNNIIDKYPSIVEELKSKIIDFNNQMNKEKRSIGKRDEYKW